MSGAVQPAEDMEVNKQTRKGPAVVEIPVWWGQSGSGQVNSQIFSYRL